LPKPSPKLLRKSGSVRFHVFRKVYKRFKLSKSMKFKTELKKIGNGGAFIMVPAPVRKHENLKVGDEVSVDISLENPTPKEKTFICKDCTHEFCSSEKTPYCPACNCEELNDVTDTVGLIAYTGIIDDFGMESFARESETRFPYVLRANLNGHRNAKAYRVRISLVAAEKFIEKFEEQKDWIVHGEELKEMNGYEELN